MKKYFAVLIFIFVTVLAFLGMPSALMPYAAEDETVLTVAFPETPGINEVYSDGTFGGCAYGWLHEIAKYTGWKYEFVTGDVDELLNGMVEGKYDLMCGMFYMEEYEEYFSYPKYIMGTNYSLLAFRNDDTTIKSFDYSTLNGKRIGVYTRAENKIERLKKFLEFNSLECELVYYDSITDYEQCLETRECDILYGSDVYTDRGYNVAVMIESEPHYIVTPAGRTDLCSQLSEAMSMIYDTDPDFAIKLYRKYFPNQYINAISFTEEENSFIESCGPIRVAVKKNRYPLYYEDKDGVAMGILPEYLQLITERTGIEFTYVYADTYNELIEMVTDGRADLFGGFMNNDNSADLMGLIRTSVLLTLDSVYIRDKNADLYGGSLTMAVPEGLDLKPINADDRVELYGGYAACVEAVEIGKADYTQMPVAFMEELYTKNYYANVTLAVANEPAEVSLAMKAPLNVELYSILNKVINNLSQEEMSTILSHNIMPIPNNSVSIKKLLYTNPVLVIIVCAIIIALIAAGIVMFNLNKTKMKVMRMELDKAQEVSRVKSDFLSRMSHEIRTPMNAIIGLTNLAMMSGEPSAAVNETLQKIDSSAKFLMSLLNDVLDMSKIESSKMKLENEPFSMGTVFERLTNMFTSQMQGKQIDFIVDCSLNDMNYKGDELRLIQVLANLISNACKFTEEGGSIRLSLIEQGREGDTVEIRFSVKDTGVGISKEDVERIFLSFEQASDRNRSSQGTGLGLSISKSLVGLMGGELQVDSEVGAGSDFHFTIKLQRYNGDLSAATEAANEEYCMLSGVKVLLVEDNDINAEIAEDLMKMKHMIVDRAENGEEAVKLFEESAEGYYDVILMDINMPVKDGLQATREIRGLKRGDAGVPVLAMTANSFDEDRERAMAAGMSGFLSKPFDVARLYTSLCSSIRKE